jgi:hypothetical protein
LLPGFATGSSTARTAAFFAFLTGDFFAGDGDSSAFVTAALLPDDFLTDALLAWDLVTVAVV